MPDYQLLKTEITVDELGRGYSAMGDQAVADDMNLVIRPKAASHSAVVDYLMNTRAHTNQGEDVTANNTTPTIIYGRLIHVAEHVVLEIALPLDPFGAGSTPTEKRVINTRQLHSAKAFLDMLRCGVLNVTLLTNTEPGNVLNDLVNCGIMNTVNRDAIIALSSNKQSRGEEIGWGSVAAIDVTRARAV